MKADGFDHLIFLCGKSNDAKMRIRVTFSMSAYLYSTRFPLVWMDATSMFVDTHAHTHCRTILLTEILTTLSYFYFQSFSRAISNTLKSFKRIFQQLKSSCGNMPPMKHLMHTSFLSWANEELQKCAFSNLNQSKSALCQLIVQVCPICGRIDFVQSREVSQPTRYQHGW